MTARIRERRRVRVAPPPPRAERIVRDTALTIRSDLYRGNLIYQGIAGNHGTQVFSLRRRTALNPAPGA